MIAFSLLFAAYTPASKAQENVGEAIAQENVEEAIDETVEMTQEDIEANIKLLKSQVDQATVEAGNLPSQKFNANLVKQDLDEIGKRLDKAAEQEGEAAKQEFQKAVDDYNDLIDKVNEAADEASGEEKAKLAGFATYLETRKEEWNGV